MKYAQKNTTIPRGRTAVADWKHGVGAVKCDDHNDGDDADELTIYPLLWHCRHPSPTDSRTTLT